LIQRCILSANAAAADRECHEINIFRWKLAIVLDLANTLSLTASRWQWRTLDLWNESANPCR